MSKLITRCLGAVFGTMLWALGPVSAFAALPDKVTTTLEGCRNDGTITFPAGGPFVCPNAAYTTGNLGKGWNELDLVPHRITMSAGNSAPATQTYTVAVAVDNFDAGHPGYDVVSTLTKNAALSSASCPAASVGSQLSVSPGIGGTDTTIYRLVTITQPKNTTCVYDWHARLALGSHLYPGASLHANMTNETLGTQGIGARDVSIPVKEIKPQELRKDMSATADSNVQWNLLKSADPTSINFGNVCAAPDGPLSKQVTFRVEWVKVGTTAGGVTFITNIYAKNPASRTITVNVTDKVYKDLVQTTLLDTKSTDAAGVDVPANTEKLVLTHTKTITDGSAGGIGGSLNDVATAVYTDKDTGIVVPGTTTATASATIGAGTVTNNFAAIGDSESITGTGLTFSVAQPAIGAFSGYTAGTPTVGPVDWGITGETTGRYVDFVKTIYLDARRVTSGELTDTAVLLASPGGFSKQAGPVVVGVSSSASVKLTISKGIPLNNVLAAGQRIEVYFKITRAGDNTFVANRTLTFGPGEFSKSVELTGLVPDNYTVTEQTPALFFSSAVAVGVDSGLQPVGGPAKSVDLTAGADGIFQASECAGTAAFTNAPAGGPAAAQVQKITDPVLGDNDPDYNWDFYLNGPGAGNVKATAQAGQGFVEFQAVLQEGNYTVTETQKTPAWLLTKADPDANNDKVCEFTVTLVDLNNGKTFSCTFYNQKQGKARVVKTVQGQAPSGTQAFTFQLRQGASDTQNGSTLETQVANAANGGVHAFTTWLKPGDTYQMCEIVMPGWSSSLGTFVPAAFYPPDGKVADPTVDNSILCVSFTVAAGETKTFTVDNTPPPGGRALTIGFWKNWASCASSGGKQAPVMDQTLALAEPNGIVVSAQGGTYPPFAATFYLILHGSAATPKAAPSCQDAVRLLNKSTIGTGKKMASDPAFNLAAQLVAAELNFTAGAGKTGVALTAVNQSVVLLGKYKFNGNTHTNISNADAATMNSLATTLDNYNNNH